MKFKYDIISIGDSQLDTFAVIEQASLLCTKDSKNCQLCLSYADKIPLTALDHAIAGNAANVAIGSARLKLQSAFYTIVGTDDIGDKIVNALEDEGVDTAYVKRDRKKPTNYSVVINYQTERTQLVYNEKRAYALPKLAKARWVYLTAIGHGVEKVHRDLLKYLEKDGTKLAYNPGHLELSQGKFNKKIMERCDVLFVNKEEAMTIVGTTKKQSTKSLLKKLWDVGPNVVVITEGANGASLYDGRHSWYMPIVDVPVIERTGAGDSFATGVISAIVHGKPYDEALRWGALNSASVIQYIGPQEGLLTKAKMSRMLKKYSEDIAEEI